MGNEDDVLVDVAIGTGEMYRARVDRWIAGGKDPDTKGALEYDIQAAIEHKKIEGALGRYLLSLINAA